ncbi:MAG: nitrous oxide reductase accessory protein NosL [Desulfomonile tiedjei]|nr:nitrous oxide reductase accessory protein NosL [Desulfomonile tiedjei]
MKEVRKTSSLGLITLAVSLIAFAAPLHSSAEDLAPLPDGSKVDLSAHCPVCGMTVGGDLGATTTYSYRDGKPIGFAGVAAAVFKDGHVVGFEGARCLFIYSAVPKRFNIEVENIARRFVTDFPSGKMVDVANTFLVLGSSVKGPMGYEVISFPTVEEAEKFKSEFGAKRVVQMGTVEFKDVERKGPSLKKPSVQETPK